MLIITEQGIKSIVDTGAKVNTPVALVSIDRVNAHIASGWTREARLCELKGYHVLAENCKRIAKSYSTN